MQVWTALHAARWKYKFRRIPTKSARYPLWKNLPPPRKSGPKFTLGRGSPDSEICHQSIGHTLYNVVCNLYRHCAVTLALDCFVSKMSLVLYRKCHFCTRPLVFHRKVGHVSLELDRSMSSRPIVQWARSLGQLVVLLFSENINLFNQGART